MNTERALKRLAILVKNSRATLGMTQEEFARLFGDRKPSVSRLERGDYIELPDHSTLEKIAQILRMPYWELLKYLLKDEEESISVKPLTKEQQIAGFKQNYDLRSLLDLNWELTVQIERCRSLQLDFEKSPDLRNNRH